MNDIWIAQRRPSWAPPSTQKQKVERRSSPAVALRSRSAVIRMVWRFALPRLPLHHQRRRCHRVGSSPSSQPRRHGSLTRRPFTGASEAAPWATGANVAGQRRPNPPREFRQWDVTVATEQPPVMASPRPTSCVPGSRVMSPSRGSDPDSRDSQPRHRVPAPAARASAAARWYAPPNLPL
jgi:hypothetical protein